MWIFNPSLVLLLCSDLFAVQGLGPPVCTPKPVTSQRPGVQGPEASRSAVLLSIKGASASVGDLCVHIEKITFKYDRERDRGGYKEYKRATQVWTNVRKPKHETFH